jgi:hypothetical protein
LSLATPTVQTSKLQLAPDNEKPFPWILHPVFDFIFVYGGGPLLLLAVNIFLLGWSVPQDISNTTQWGFLVLVFIGQHLFADSHNMATYLRIWGSDEDRQRFRFHRTVLVQISAFIFVAGLFFPAVTSVLVYLYFLLVFWHYAAQTFGISLIYCYKRGYFFTKREKEIYRAMILTFSAFVVVRFLTYKEMSPQVWFGVPLPFWGPLPVEVLWIVETILGLLLFAWTVIVLRKLVYERRMFPLPSFLMLLTIFGLGFAVGSSSAMIWMYVPAYFHGSQYLAVSLSYHLKEKNLPEGMPAADIWQYVWTPAAQKFLGFIVVTGGFFYVVIPSFFAQIGFSYSLVAGLVLGVVNFHHFITDAAIWRLRDPRCRKILLA